MLLHNRLNKIAGHYWVQIAMQGIKLSTPWIATGRCDLGYGGFVAEGVLKMMRDHEHMLKGIVRGRES
jgi:hypothetical protein